MSSGGGFCFDFVGSYGITYVSSRHMAQRDRLRSSLICVVGSILHNKPDSILSAASVHE